MENTYTENIRPQNLILEGRGTLSVTGVSEVIGFDDSFVVMNTSLGMLTVQGEAMHVESLSLEKGELLVRGKISDLHYEEKAKHSRLWTRLFGE